ncbi:conserved hypothetical protein [Ricinus communis]|uniref:Uncharacterized protein n=1 Tax=Ricinus communis TaxID=3988 RepID=B9SQF2_RICCO|nr:conserved hypothetical protein [Ricinus communis]
MEIKTLETVEAIDAVEIKIDSLMNDNLCGPYTNEEIMEALSQLHSSKALGPDAWQRTSSRKVEIVGCIHGTEVCRRASVIKQLYFAITT